MIVKTVSSPHNYSKAANGPRSAAVRSMCCIRITIIADHLLVEARSGSKLECVHPHDQLLLADTVEKIFLVFLMVITCFWYFLVFFAFLKYSCSIAFRNPISLLPNTIA